MYALNRPHTAGQRSHVMPAAGLSWWRVARKLQVGVAGFGNGWVCVKIFGQFAAGTVGSALQA